MVVAAAGVVDTAMLPRGGDSSPGLDGRMLSPPADAMDAEDVDAGVVVAVVLTGEKCAVGGAKSEDISGSGSGDVEGIVAAA